jgi:hypothetical protein
VALQCGGLAWIAWLGLGFAGWLGGALLTGWSLVFELLTDWSLSGLGKGPIVLVFCVWPYLVPLSCLLSDPLTELQPMVWGFPLFARGLGWFYSGNQLLETLGLVLSYPLLSWQPMAKGFFFFFYNLIDH